jgi:hypothetical protein
VKPLAAVPGTEILSAPGSRRRLRARLRRSLPGIGEIFAGGVLWGTAMAGSAVFGILMQDWETDAKIQSVAVLYALGGASAFPIGLFVARLLSLGRSGETAFPAAILAFAAARSASSG